MNFFKFICFFAVFFLFFCLFFYSSYFDHDLLFLGQHPAGCQAKLKYSIFYTDQAGVRRNMDGTAFDFSRTNPQSVFTDSIESSSCKNTDADQSTVRRACIA